MTLDEQIDKILQALVDFATQRFDDELGIAYSAPVAKLAIKALIADEVKKAIDDYQTNFEQRHIASAVQLARIDELKHLVEDGGIWYQDMTRQFPQKITLNQRIKELE